MYTDTLISSQNAIHRLLQLLCHLYAQQRPIYQRTLHSLPFRYSGLFRSSNTHCSELFTLVGCDPLHDNINDANVAQNAAQSPVIIVLHSVDELSTQSQIYLAELLVLGGFNSEGVRIMFVCTFPETSHRLLHPQLVRQVFIVRQRFKSC